LPISRQKLLGAAIKSAVLHHQHRL